MMFTSRVTHKPFSFKPIVSFTSQVGLYLSMYIGLSIPPFLTEIHTFIISSTYSSATLCPKSYCQVWHLLLSLPRNSNFHTDPPLLYMCICLLIIIHPSLWSSCKHPSFIPAVSSSSVYPCISVTYYISMYLCHFLHLQFIIHPRAHSFSHHSKGLPAYTQTHSMMLILSLRTHICTFI